jgi:hypothetical protein
MKFIKNLRLLFLLVFLAVYSCSSEGTPTETYTISGSIIINDSDNYIDSQIINVGLFINETVPEYSITLEKPTNQEAIPYSFQNVDEGTYTCKIYVAENGVYKTDLYSYNSKNINETTNLGTASVNLLTYSRVQSQLINKCIQCHGGAAGEPAAGLILLENESYTNLVNAESTYSDLLRVKTYDTTNSFLIHVLENNNLSFEHPSSTLATEADLELVKLWINKGAINN